jgi:hypothetical protein
VSGCVFAAAATASDSRPLSQDEFGPVAVFHLTGSHGYRIDVTAFGGSEGRQGRIFVSVSRPGESADYAAPAIVSDAFVQADLGALGKVDLAVRGSGREKTVPVKCSRESIAYEPGSYEGIVEFNGEGGYTSVSAARVPIAPLYSSFCGRGGGYGESFGPAEPGADLRGLSFAQGRRLVFQVNKNSPKARTVFSASLKERHAGISIYRTLSGTAPPGAFRFDRRLRHAELAPPSPFSGSASLVRDSTALFPRWTGDLTIDFPGRKVHAAGPEVHVSIRHAHFIRSNSADVEIGA